MDLWWCGFVAVAAAVGECLVARLIEPRAMDGVVDLDVVRNY